MTREAVLIDRDGRPTLRFERSLGQPLERVWRAVTDEHEMRSWFPCAVQGERKVGAPLRFPFDEQAVDTFEGTVTAWEPMSVFAFTWNGDELRIELTDDGDSTTLVFTHALSHVSPAARTGSGWEACLADLAAHLGGPAVDPELWRRVYPVYLERMGPPAATAIPQWSMTWERGHHVSVERLWECLTDPTELRAWMGGATRVDIDLRRGGAIRFDFGVENGIEDGIIVALEPERRIAYTWGSALAVVDWRLEPAEHGCRFTLTKHGMPEPRAAGWGAGWHSFLLQLDMYLASGQLVVDEHEPRIPAYEALIS